MRRIVTLALLAVVPMVLAQQGAQTKPASEGDAMKKPSETKPSPTTTQAAGGTNVKVVLETNRGNITLELDGDKAPISTKNFVDYVEAKFYDGLIFHRVMSNFMIQGGGFTPDMQEKHEGLRDPIRNEWRNGLKNVRGTIAMARTSQPDSATAQFFINVVNNDPLDTPRDGAAYAVFGRVVDGMDVVDAIRDTEVGEHPALPMGKVVPTEPVIIQKARVVGEYDRKALEEKATAADKKLGEAGRNAGAAAQKELDEFLAKTEKELGRKPEKTDSGMYYWVIKEGAGESPTKVDRVTVHYRGQLLNGHEFDSSYKRNQPTSFPLSNVIRGWTEGVSLMKTGETRKYVIPPNLAYGAPGRPPVIPPNSWLVFDIELISIDK